MAYSMLTRRTALAGMTLSLGGALLAACGSGAASGSAASTPAPPSSSAATSAASSSPATTAASSAASAAPATTSAASAASAAAAASSAASTSSAVATSSVTSSSSPVAAAPAAPASGQTVVWSTYTAGAARDKIAQDLASKAQAKTGLKLQFKIEPGDHYWDNLQLRFTGGGAPDVTVNQVDWIQPGAARGVFVALDSSMARDNIKREDYIDYKSWLYQGKIYGMPFQGGGECTFLNKKLFQSAGVTLPTADWDWQTCLSAAQKLAQGTGPAKIYGVTYGYLTMYVNLGSFVLDNGAKVLNDARDKALYGDDQQSIAAAQWVVDTMLKSKVAPTPVSEQGQPNPMTTGKVAMDIHAFFFTANVQQGIGDENMGILPIPKGPTGTRTMATGSNAWSILGSSKVQDAAWQLIAYLESQEGQIGWAPAGLPALTSVATSDVFLNLYPNQKDDLKLLLTEWAKNGHDYFITPDTDAWWTTAEKYLAPMYAGEQTVPQAMKASADAVNTQVFAKRQSS